MFSNFGMDSLFKFILDLYFYCNLINSGVFGAHVRKHFRLESKMVVEGVLISFNVNENVFSSSGILIKPDLVLVPGSILLPFMQEEGWMSSFLKLVSTKIKSNDKIKNILFRVLVERKTEKQETQTTDVLSCRVSGVWRCPAVSESMNKLFSEWTVGDVNVKKEWEMSTTADIEMSKDLMSIFVLLKAENKLQCNKSNDIRALTDLLDSLEEPRRGQEVEIVSTPFGNEYFFNSLSQGIISNVVGVNKCIILSDARTAPGCEGGLIFASKKSSIFTEKERKLVGLVIWSVSWWRGEWVGLTIGINLTSVLKMLKNATKVAEQNSVRVANFVEDKLARKTSVLDLLSVHFIDETVVLIRSESCWGSGIVLSATSGVIITCSHVVKNDKTVSVFYRGKQWPASVIYKSPEDVAYDLAVIKTRENSIFRKEILSYCSAEIGDAVVAAGFPFFSEKDDLHIKPTLACGSVSKVSPFMIQTTCCIQSGFSGGAVFKNGKLLGIIASNVRDSSGGAHFPHINFIIPSSVFIIPVFKYIKQNDIGNLKELESSNPRVQMLWRLQTSKL